MSKENNTNYYKLLFIDIKDFTKGRISPLCNPSLPLSFEMDFYQKSMHAATHKNHLCRCFCRLQYMELFICRRQSIQIFSKNYSISKQCGGLVSVN